MAIVAPLVAFLILAAEPSPPDSMHESGEEREYLNAISIRPAFTFHKLKERGAVEQGAPEVESMVGFILSYGRIVIPELLLFEVSKPFFFNAERFDSPLELLIGLFHPFGEWEPFVSFGPAFNFRVFEGERGETEGESSEFSLGLAMGAGLVWAFSERWHAVAELSYGFIPDSAIVEHEITTSLGVAYCFGR